MSVDANAGGYRSSRSGVGPGYLALWVLLLVNLAWFLPFALVVEGGLLQALTRS